MGFVCTFTDHSVYVYECGSSVIIVPLYVDDLLIGFKDEEHMLRIKKALEERFKMTDAGPASWVLGMQIWIDMLQGMVSIDQSQYIRKVLQRYGMADCKPVATLLPKKVMLRAASDEEAEAAWNYLYLQVIGSVMYAMLGTRPDIAYAVSTLSHYSSRPGIQHVNALKHLLRYLKGSMEYRIVYSCNGGGLMGCESEVKSNEIQNNIIGYTDSNYAMDLDTHCSVSGAVFLLTGGPISWSSKLQNTISQSSTEAEYIASTEATKEAVWL